MVRFKSRWLLIEFLEFKSVDAGEDSPLTLAIIKDAIRQSVLLNFGDEGWGSVGSSLYVKYFSPTTNICIVRVGREHHRIVWGAITLLTTINDRVYIPHVRHVSGTLKQGQLAAIEYNHALIARLRAKSDQNRDHAWDNYLTRSDAEISAIDPN